MVAYKDYIKQQISGLERIRALYALYAPSYVVHEGKETITTAMKMLEEYKVMVENDSREEPF